MRSSVAGFLPMKSKKENLLRTVSTGKIIASPVGELRRLVRYELLSFGTRARVIAAGVGGALVVSALVLGVAAAGLGLLAVAAFVVALRRPCVLGPMVALLLPARETIVVLNAQVSPLEAVVGGGALGYLGYVLAARERVRLSMSDWTFMALVALIALSTVGPVDNSDRFRELILWGALAITFHAVRTHGEKPPGRTLLLVSLAVATIVEVSYALFEYIDRWSERFSALGGALVYPLPEGTLGHPNALAQFLVLAGLTVVALALGERGWVRPFGVLAGMAGSLALLVTFSRASWIAWTAGASVYLVERRARRPVLLMGAAAAAVALALALLDKGAIGARIASLFGGTSDLYGFRFALMGRAAEIAAEHPLTGSGHFEETGIYAGREALATHPHNLFLG
ncbi:MAG: O-antigen ligase family protein, partial [Gaiellaceae bacterium]